MKCQCMPSQYLSAAFSLLCDKFEAPHTCTQNRAEEWASGVQWAHTLECIQNWLGQLLVSECTCSGRR